MFYYTLWYKKYFQNMFYTSKWLIKSVLTKELILFAGIEFNRLRIEHFNPGFSNVKHLIHSSMSWFLVQLPATISTRLYLKDFSDNLSQSWIDDSGMISSFISDSDCQASFTWVSCRLVICGVFCNWNFEGLSLIN